MQSGFFRRVAVGLAVAVAIAAMAAAPSTAREDSLKAKQQACFERMKKLAGVWVSRDASGKELAHLQYRVISGGSALEEDILVGGGEMVSIYHMDGDSLVMTHYCMLGNQPHLKATAESTPKRIEFKCTGKGSNMKSEADLHIHHATFVFDSDDRLTSFWGANKDGKPEGQEMKFELSRKAAQ
jgi:hypothetical protein